MALFVLSAKLSNEMEDVASCSSNAESTCEQTQEPVDLWQAMVGVFPDECVGAVCYDEKDLCAVIRPPMDARDCLSLSTLSIAPNANDETGPSMLACMQNVRRAAFELVSILKTDSSGVFRTASADLL